MKKSLDEFRMLIALLATGAVGCGSSEGVLDRTGFEPLCAGESYDPLPGTSLAVAADYYELRAQITAQSNSSVSTLSKSGTPCVSAAQTATCTTALSAFRSEEGVQQPSLGRALAQHLYLVMNRGDAVDALTTRDTIQRAFLPVDTAKDAAFLATFASVRTIQCTTGAVKRTSTGYEVIVRSGGGCGEGDDVVEIRVGVATDGTQTDLERRTVMTANPSCAYGRVPEGLVSSARGGPSIGDHFARAARLEAASVIAFERMAGELVAHAAPEVLVAMARRCAAEERRHAIVTGEIARRHGVEPLAAEVDEPRPRSLFALALENAREGCVRETFGALLATRQAHAAEDADVRAAMATIADDETRHAWFSWEMHRWACARLGEEGATKLEAARRDAAVCLAEDLAGEELSEQVRRSIGHPSRPETVALFDALFELTAAA